MMMHLIATRSGDRMGDYWQHAVDEYTVWMQAAGASPATVRLRRHWLRRAAAVVAVDPWSVSPDDLVSFVATAHWSPETRKSVRSTLRGFYRWGVESGRAERDPASSLPPVKVPTGQPRPTPRRVVTGALLGADRRDRTMILLAVLAGLRRSEISRVHSDDVVTEVEGFSLRVHGKGGRVRTVPLHDVLASELLAAPHGFVFPGQIDGHLSPGYVGKRLTAALGGFGWTAHTLRHRFATDAYAVERDLFAVQQLLGHSKPETTARYTAVPRDSLRAAVDGGGGWAA